MENVMRKIPMILLVLLLGCGEEFLDIKRNANQVVPKEIRDYKAILARSNMLITSSDLSYLGADEYYIPTNAELITASQFTPFHQYAYIWADDVYGEEINTRDWHEAYERIMYANLALDVRKLTPSASEEKDWKEVQIAALFYRAWNFYQLAQLFCKPYDIRTASTDLGLPLRMDYDVSVTYPRSSLQEVYDRILDDLHVAEALEASYAFNMYLPTDLAVKALLARTYLQLGNYEEALKYADGTLAAHRSLLDYNTIVPKTGTVYDSYFPVFGKNHPEIIFYSFRAVGGLFGATRVRVDTSYYNSLSNNDLRKKLLFFQRPNGSRVFTGSYCGYGANNPFTGFTTGEMLLIRAECRARLDDRDRAVDDLNLLRKHRYSSEGYTELKVEHTDDLLKLILEERKREMYMRGVRWEDLRRLNREGKYTESLRRILEGVEYVLPPNSNKWVWPIPQSEIVLNKLQQNAR